MSGSEGLVENVEVRQEPRNGRFGVGHYDVRSKSCIYFLRTSNVIVDSDEDTESAEMYF
jgi:hypothetical protein